MQSGLNIGIGAWIDAQHGQGGRPAFPATAIPFRLSHLGTLTAPEDLARAVELSILANRLGDDSWLHDSGGVPVYLWERHREVVGGMETAISTLSQTQRAALTSADAVLFGPDGFTISDRYALYNETRQIYQDMVIAGGAPAEVQVAYQNWVTIGHKTVIEEALAIKMSLECGTSRVAAASDVTRIEVALDTLGGDVPFAPTLFTPISATSSDHWTEAEVDFQALEDAIPPEVPRDDWTRFRARKNGTVRFRFVAVDLLRGWFSPAVYAADDWRTRDVVADGQGRNGQLPAYYSRLYMAQVLDVKHDNVRPSAPPAKPGLVTALRPQTLTTAAIVRPAAAAAPAPRPRPVLAAVRPSALLAVPRSVVDAPRATRGVTTVRPTHTAKATTPVKPVIAAQHISRLDAMPHTKIGNTLGRISKIQNLTAISAVSKLNFALAQLAAPVTTPPPQESTTYLVAFGRTNLPACPNPNPYYQWP
jgi:hypothetical protein